MERQHQSKRASRRRPHPLAHATDRELLALHLKGDPIALEHLLRRYRRLRQGCIRNVVRGDVEREDALWSDVCFRVLCGIDRFDHSRPVANWLNTIISNVVRNEVRRLARCRIVYTPAAEDPESWEAHLPIHVPTFNRAPDDDLFVRELAGALGAELGALPEAMSVAVWLSLGEGRPTANTTAFGGGTAYQGPCGDEEATSRTSTMKRGGP